MATKKNKKAKAVACVMCRTGSLKPGVTTVTLHRGNTVLVVKNVPADVCNQCGEPYLDENVADRISRLADDAVKRGAEVEILRYAA
jgi:YgiT-type zinc finger domain-containing protein